MVSLAFNKSVLKKAATVIRPSDFLDYQKYLHSLYEYLKNNGVGINYRKFSDLLGFGASTLIHQVVKGYRPLTIKSAQKLIEKLDLDKAQKSYLENLVKYKNGKSADERELALKKLLELKNEVLPSVFDRDMLSYFSEWYHPIIREMVLQEEFSNDPEWVASQLRPAITKEEAKASLELLERIGYISYDKEKKKFVPAEATVHSGHDIQGMGLLKYHINMMDRAKEVLNRSRQEEREYGSVTFNLPEGLMPELKKKIHQWQMDLLNTVDNHPVGDRVYQFNLQLFPLTKKKEKDQS